MERQNINVRRKAVMLTGRRIDELELIREQVRTALGESALSIRLTDQRIIDICFRAFGLVRAGGEATWGVSIEDLAGNFADGRINNGWQRKGHHNDNGNEYKDEA